MSNLNSPTKDNDILNNAADSIPPIQQEIQNLDHAKKPFMKQVGKHKKAIRKVLKRKLETLQLQDPQATEIEVEVGDFIFRLEEITSCAPCKFEDMPAFFSKENIEKYEEAMTKKRLKLNIEES
tara:strand:+ start:75 stop:446 length:372 start_codon:yes stop_codon:yes gene_type:complete